MMKEKLQNIKEEALKAIEAADMRQEQRSKLFWKKIKKRWKKQSVQKS